MKQYLEHDHLQRIGWAFTCRIVGKRYTNVFLDPILAISIKSHPFNAMGHPCARIVVGSMILA
jgi:hypothetical protein